MPVFAAEVQIDDFVVCRQRDTVECADRRLRPRFEPAWERMPRASHRVLQGAMDRALQDGLRGTLVEQFSPHGLRAGFVTTAYRNGVPKNSWVIPSIGAKGLSLDNCFIHRVAVERMCSSTRRGSWRVGC
jgi:hypothetical protein